MKQKGFEGDSHNRHNFVSFNILLMLLLIEQGSVFKKDDGKKDLVETPGSRYDKMVFALLNEVLAVHVRLALIYVWCSGFKRSFSELIKVLQQCKGPGL